MTVIPNDGVHGAHQRQAARPHFDPPSTTSSLRTRTRRNPARRTPQARRKDPRRECHQACSHRRRCGWCSASTARYYDWHGGFLSSTMRGSATRPETSSGYSASAAAATRRMRNGVSAAPMKALHRCAISWTLRMYMSFKNSGLCIYTLLASYISYISYRCDM